MDLASAADELYAMDPDGFIARRTEIVKQLRADKQRDEAKQVAALRRPTRSAWLVNLVARHRGDELGELLDLGPALAQAHTGGDPELMRTLSVARRRAVSALVDAALALGREAGYRPSDAVRDEVSLTLESALAQPDLGAVVRQGTLSQAAGPSGELPTDLFAGLIPGYVPSPPRLTVVPAAEPDPAPEPDERDEVAEGLRRAEREAREQAVRDAEAAEREAVDALTTAAEAESRAGAATKQAEVRVAELREMLAAAERELAEAQLAADEAENQLTSAGAERQRRAEHTRAARDHLAELEES